MEGRAWNLGENIPSNSRVAQLALWVQTPFCPAASELLGVFWSSLLFFFFFPSLNAKYSFYYILSSSKARVQKMELTSDHQVMLTLEIKLPVILPAKMGLFWNSRELQPGTSELWQIHRQVCRAKESRALLQRKGGAGRCCQLEVRE